MSARVEDGSTKKRLLVVDDDASLRELYAEALAAEGFEVVTARDGLEAFELFLTCGPFDALVVDQDMPRLTGKELLGRLRSLGKGAPAVLVSGRLEVGPSEGRSLGLGASLSKPFSRDSLIQAIRRLLSAEA